MPISAEPEGRGSSAPSPIEVRILGGQAETSQCWGRREMRDEMQEGWKLGQAWFELRRH